MGGAISAGFRLIRREPVAFVVWTALYAVIGVIPQLVVARGVLGAAAARDPAALQRVQALQPLQFVTGLLVLILFYGAIQRAQLRPQERGLFFLRLGRRELWMLLTLLAVLGIALLGMVVTLVPLGLLGASAGRTPSVASSFAVILGVLGLLGVAFWGSARIVCAVPMSFDESGFRLRKAWRLTRGSFWRIFGVYAALFGMLLAVELALFGLILGAVFRQNATALMANPMQMFSQLGPVGITAAVVALSAFGAASYTVFVAAGARIYQDLKGDNPADAFA